MAVVLIPFYCLLKAQLGTYSGFPIDHATGFGNISPSLFDVCNVEWLASYEVGGHREIAYGLLVISGTVGCLFAAACLASVCSPSASELAAYELCGNQAQLRPVASGTGRERHRLVGTWSA